MKRGEASGTSESLERSNNHYARTMGAIVATVVAGRDTYIQLFVAHIPEFYVRTKLEVATDNDGKQIDQLVVRIANIGSETATLDPGLYVLTIDSKNGKMIEAHLTFSEKVANTSTPAYIPGQPPTLRTGEEAAAWAPLQIWYIRPCSRLIISP
jgi:hypothetical protein